jgi:hypothetical protein
MKCAALERFYITMIKWPKSKLCYREGWLRHTAGRAGCAGAHGWRIGWLWVVLSACLSPLQVHAHPPVAESHRYVEDDGVNRVEIQWCLGGVDGRRLVYQAAAETHITETDTLLHTHAWSMHAPHKETAVTVRRQGDTLLVSGRVQGEAADSRIVLDDDPWFQATSLSLRPFIMSEERRIRFWLLRPDTLKAYKLTATRQGVETLALPSGPTPAVKVVLRAGGILAPFWSSTYWFRADDGLFLRFEGPGDAFGRTTLTVSYGGTGAACDGHAR